MCIGARDNTSRDTNYPFYVGKMCTPKSAPVTKKSNSHVSCPVLL
jgi:hypothetical protein